MPQLETGLFVFMLAFSFGFMIWGFFRQTGIFTNILRMMSIAAFFGLALYMGSGYEVSQTTTTVIEALNSSDVVVELDKTETNILIPANSASWLSWAFMGFGILNMILIIREVWK